VAPLQTIALTDLLEGFQSYGVLWHFPQLFSTPSPPWDKKCLVFTSCIVWIGKQRYLSYPEGDFEVFRPTRMTHCTDGVKFGSPLLRAKFHPHQCNDKFEN